VLAMVSPPIRNLLGGVCLAFLLCGTLMAWSKHKVTTSTLVVSADRDESNEQEATAQVCLTVYPVIRVLQFHPIDLSLTVYLHIYLLYLVR